MKKRILSLLLALALGLTPAALAVGGEGVRIAVIDTGISTAAVDPARIAPGLNYIRPQDDTGDKLGHGTAVSSIIVGSESARISGICPTATLVPLVIASQDEDGKTVQGDTAMTAQAIYAAVDVYDCCIINISSGAARDSSTLRGAVSYAARTGALIVSSAGNNQQTNPGAVYYPGGYDSVLCVGAATDAGEVAAFSQQNDTVDLLARGTGLRIASVKGTAIRGYGTSYSTAIVTGTAAQIWTQYPDLTADEVRDALMDSCRPVNGWNVLDLEAALAWAPEETVSIFSDVAEDAYYYDAVLWAAESGITGGTGAGTFSPDAPCTRGQMATFLWRSVGSPEPESGACPFTDVDASAYYGKAVLWAVENGITGGTSATTFSPDAPCTRGQMATFLCRMEGGEPVSSTPVFADVSPSAYYAEPVQWAYEQGITGGTSATTFSPDAPCTRGQMVTFLYRSCSQ